MQKFASIAVVAFMATGLGIGAAATETPKTTGAFVTSCKTDMGQCESTILGWQFMAVTNNGKSNTKSCVIPSGVDTPTATPAVVDWLASHRETHTQPTTAGIAAAVKALWQCKDRVENGATPGGVPNDIGRYIAFCDDRDLPQRRRS